MQTTNYTPASISPFMCGANWPEEASYCLTYRIKSCGIEKTKVVYFNTTHQINKWLEDMRGWSNCHNSYEVLSVYVRYDLGAQVERLTCQDWPVYFNASKSASRIQSFNS